MKLPYALSQKTLPNESSRKPYDVALNALTNAEESRHATYFASDLERALIAAEVPGMRKAMTLTFSSEGIYGTKEISQGIHHLTRWYVEEDLEKVFEAVDTLGVSPTGILRRILRKSERQEEFEIATNTKNAYIGRAYHDRGVTEGMNITLREQLNDYEGTHILDDLEDALGAGDYEPEPYSIVERQGKGIIVTPASIVDVVQYINHTLRESRERT